MRVSPMWASARTPWATSCWATGRKSGGSFIASDADAADVSVQDPVARTKAYLLNPRRNALISEFRLYLADQIDRYRAERADNLISRMVGQPIYAHITLEKGERSALSELASDLL